jgi:hypothetical protein
LYSDLVKDQVILTLSVGGAYAMETSFLWKLWKL